MTKIIEELQARVAASKKRLDDTSQVFQAAQQAFQGAQHEHNVWTLALQTEVRDEQRRTAAATEKQLPLPTPTPKPQTLTALAPEQPVDNSEALNKTDAVRDLLRQHPTGMTATEIWKEISMQFKHRPYLYSVLKRLRDREEVILRRKKYCLKLIPRDQEVKEQPIVH